MINLSGPTTATTAGLLTAATYSFIPDMANDARSKVYVVSAIGGTQPGVNAHTADLPKLIVFKKPANWAVLGGYSATTGRWARVPKNTFRVVGKIGVLVAAGQTEIMTLGLDIPIPAGALSYDQANTEAGIVMFLQGIINQLPGFIATTKTGLM